MTQRNANECIFSSRGETLSCIQVFLLDYLYHQGNQPVYQKDLESIFSIRRSSVTGILNNLAQKGLIQRQSVSGDARLKQLVLTEKALELQPEISALLNQIGETAFFGVTESEIRQFYLTIEKLKTNLSGLENLHNKESE